MRGLITDRERENVLRRDSLASKGRNMTALEEVEWFGDPMDFAGANLFPPGPNYSSSVNMKYRNDSIVATSLWDGTYIYGISIIGDATKYAGKTLTLSVDSIVSIGGGKPQISMYWHDENGYEYAGASLTEAGSVTFETFANANNRAYLAAYIYVTSDAPILAGAMARFFGVMLESGSIRHEFVPYTEVIATNATKGAYNYSDLNRVERAIAEISDDLGLGLITKTNWTEWDIPRASNMDRYLNNVKALRNFQKSNLTLPESMSELTYSMANNIETVIADVHEAMNTSVRCGEIICGDL